MPSSYMATARQGVLCCLGFNNNSKKNSENKANVKIQKRLNKLRKHLYQFNIKIPMNATHKRNFHLLAHMACNL